MPSPAPDGNLYEGTVTCPWHGSEFSVETGEVEMPRATAARAGLRGEGRGDKIQVARTE
jgi:nitrite reductase/ring-hydroxylating ferredoxin subunit